MAGLLAARGGTSIIVALAPRALPRIDEIRLDGTVLTFTPAASLVTGVVFGVLPAWTASRVDVNDALNRLLRQREHRNFRFTILQRVSIQSV